MTVGQLLAHLRSLAQLLEAGGARSAAELHALCEALSDRNTLSLSAWVAELRSPAPVVATPASEPPLARPTTSKKVSPELEALSRETQQMYESASSPLVTHELVDQLITRLSGLSKENLLSVAERIGLKGLMNKNKKQIQEAIKDRILKRKGVIIRASMSDRL
jgi:hypothetical protein